ncbi:hypothetical protein [Enterobacter hormaechei]|uniref:hypothetical protein n=1 Tax=Enterobacter hormaechei TaxID=158836 RepID=UPI0038502ABF
MDVLRFILRLPFILLRLAARSLVYLFTLLGFLLRPFTGRIRWAVPGWVTFAGNQLARLERGQPLSENHICLIITDCCGGSGQLLHLALVSEQTEAGGCCAAGGAGYFRVCAAPFGG